MLAQHALFTALGVAPLLPGILAAVDVPPGWAQFGVGIAALYVLYRLLAPNMKAQAAETVKMRETLERVATGQAIQTEVNRGLKDAVERLATKVETSTASESRTAEALMALNRRLESQENARHAS